MARVWRSATGSPARPMTRSTSMPQPTVPPVVFGTPDWSLRRDGGGLKLPLAKLGWREEAVALDQPGRIVGFPEPEQRLPQLLDGLEGPHPEQVFLQRADEALGTAIAFWCPHEGGRTLDAEEGQFFLEMIGHVLRAVVVAHGQTAGDCLGEPTEMLPHALADWLQGLEAGGPGMRVDADAFGGAVIDCDEYRGLAFAGDRRRQVGTPHRINPFRDDGAVVIARPPRRAGPRRREQIVLAHQPQHPAQRGAGAGMPQSRPDLAVPLAMERAGGKHAPDRYRQRLIRHRTARPAPLRRRWRRGGQVTIHARAGEPPHPADRGQAIRFAGNRRDSPAHGLRLRRAKGRPASSRAIFSFSRSRSISAAPSLAFSRSLSSSSPVAARLVRAASPPARKESCQPVSVAAVTPNSRETVSRSSPRNRLNRPGFPGGRFD